ncbi:hypothetical protein BT93_J0663 [Corymbia citriodora subsp. variegata]|nr:hypothetical protein BT93_J0663 [Corymbia citriodora subsp. variegata]
MPSSLQLHRINSSHPTTVIAGVAVNFHKQIKIVDAVSRADGLPRFEPVPEFVAQYHTHAVAPNQCCCSVVQTVDAPVSAVWSVVRRFDNPQAYKHFLKSCQVIDGDGDVGTLREVHVVSGLPAVSSMERLEILDDEQHVMSFSIVGGDHRLANYRSVTTLHSTSDGSGTVVIESYVVDVPHGNTKEDTSVFVDTIVRCNLQSLAQIFESSAKRSLLK